MILIYIWLKHRENLDSKKGQNTYDSEQQIIQKENKISQMIKSLHNLETLSIDFHL